MMMCHCPVLDGAPGEKYCIECYNQIEEVEFARDYIDFVGGHNRNRMNKFLKLLNKVDGLDNFCRASMIDLFPRLEKYFLEACEMKNFINLSNLCYEMCQVLGYPDEAVKFRRLKTLNKCERVKNFLKSCMDYYGYSGEPVKRLCDLDLIELYGYPEDCRDPRVLKNDHIFSDFTNRR